MRHLGRNLRFLGDPEDFVQRLVDMLAFIPHVGRIDAAVPAGGARERDQLVGLGIARGRVFERRPHAQRALLHQRVDDRRHVRELRRSRVAILIADHSEAHLRRADEGRDVERHALPLELCEVAVQVTPVFAVMPFLHGVGIVLHQLVGERRDRATLAGHFRRDALRHLRQDAR